MGELVGQWEYQLNNTTAVRMIRKGKRYFFSCEKIMLVFQFIRLQNQVFFGCSELTDIHIVSLNLFPSIIQIHQIDTNCT